MVASDGGLHNTAQAFGLLLLGLMLHHGLLRAARLPWSEWPHFQARLRVPTLLPIFLGTLFLLARGNDTLAPLLRGLTPFLHYSLVMTAVELVLTPLFEGPRSLRLPESVGSTLRLTLWFGLLLLPVLLVAQVPVFDPVFQERAAATAFLWLALHLIYVYLVKWMPWRHPLALALRQRLRLGLYVLLLCTVAWFAMLHFETVRPGDVALTYARALLVMVMGGLAFEAVLVSLFDYYFPLLRRWDVPTLFRDLARGLGYLALVAIVMVSVFKKDPGSLLLGSAVLSVALGFALQETLGNFFAGLALRLARPYTLGDRIEFASLTGNVQKIDWRSTALSTNQGDLLIVPNSKLAQETIINHSSPTSVTGRYIEVGAHYRHAPNVVKQVLLNAAASVPECLSEPSPEVYVLNFSDSAVTYRLRFFIDDFSQRYRYDSKMREAIWYHFHREGVEIPFPSRVLYQGEHRGGVDLEREVSSLLDQVEWLALLDESHLALLRRRARYEVYAAGEKVCVQGHPGESLYIIRRGRLQVTAQDEQGNQFLSAEMRSGQYFGEMALLTGEPRSATVTALTDAELLRLRKEDLRTIFLENPQVEEVVSQKLAERKLKTDLARQEAQEASDNRANSSGTVEGLQVLSQQILAKIRNFFSY